MTTKRTFQSLVAIFSLALILVSCGLAKSTAPRPTDTVGTNPDELEAKLAEIMENAGGTLETAEFASINSSCSHSGKTSYSVDLEIVKPQNKNRLAEAKWYSSESSPNDFSVTDIVLSDSENNVIKEYDQFKDILFTYADIEQYINHSSACFKEALEASGYGADGYVERITISREQYNNNKLKASIKVTHKSDRTLKKYYQIQEDGMHIVKK